MSLPRAALFRGSCTSGSSADLPESSASLCLAMILRSSHIAPFSIAPSLSPPVSSWSIRMHLSSCSRSQSLTSFVFAHFMTVSSTSSSFVTFSSELDRTFFRHSKESPRNSSESRIRRKFFWMNASAFSIIFSFFSISPTLLRFAKPNSSTCKFSRICFSQMFSNVSI